jgi:hypothetical protein
MTPDLQANFICDDVRQERNGKFIIIGIFDAIMMAHIPGTHPRLFIVTRWCSGEGSFTQRTRILQPDGVTPLVEARDIPFTLASTETVATNVEAFLNTTFNASGTYWIEILLDNDLKLRYPLRVAALAPPATPSSQV